MIVVSNLVILFTKASSSASRINEVLAMTASVVEVPAHAPAAKRDGAAPVISFRNVSFGYNTTGELALENISVDILKGQTVGLIGSTGSGKTTFVNLIPRFYDAVVGEVRVEGVNVRDYRLEQLRSRIGIVPQKAVLFTGTIAENIRWGRRLLPGTRSWPRRQ